MHLRSKGFCGRVIPALLLFALSSMGASAQSALDAVGGGQRSTAQQPGLTVDRDPVASPDPDPPAQIATEPPQGVGTGKIEREGGKYTLRTDAYEVRLNATVLDTSGRSVLDLTRDAFKVYEDGVPQTIASFRHEDLPVSLGILIDSSGSMYDKRAAVQQSSLDLVKLSNPQDEAFVVDFSWEAFIDQDFTSNIDKLKEGLGYIKSSGGTAMYDALVASADYLNKNAKHPKQVLLVITDGEDNASTATLEQAIRRIQDLDGPTIYCVGLLFGEDTNKSESRHAKRVLEALAEQTGGVAYFPRNLKEVGRLRRRVAQDIRTQYTITYRSTKSPTLVGIVRCMWRRSRRAMEGCRCGHGRGTIRMWRRMRGMPGLSGHAGQDSEKPAPKGKRPN